MRFKPNRKILVPGASATSPSASIPVIANEAAEPKRMEPDSGESLRDTEVFENLDQLEEHLETISPPVPAACDPVVIVNTPPPIVSDVPPLAADESKLEPQFVASPKSAEPMPATKDAEIGVARLRRKLLKKWLGSPLAMKLSMLMVIAGLMALVVALLAPGLSSLMVGYAVGHGFGLLLGSKATRETWQRQMNWLAVGRAREE